MLLRDVLRGSEDDPPILYPDQQSAFHHGMQELGILQDANGPCHDSVAFALVLPFVTCQIILYEIVHLRLRDKTSLKCFPDDGLSSVMDG